MKKIISMIFIIIILIAGTVNVKATDEQAKNIELNVSGQTTIGVDERTVEVIIALGNFTGISENIVLGYQATLEYDENMFDSIKVEGLNSWTATYEESTQILIGELATATAKANTNITKITLTLKDGIEPGTMGTINLKNIELTDGTNDFTYNKSITVKVEEEKTEEPNTNTTGDTNTIQDNTTNTNEQNQAGNLVDNKVSATNTPNSASGLNKVNSNNVDNTKAVKSIPKAGMTNILIIGICVITIAGIIFKIKSRKIKY